MSADNRPQPAPRTWAERTVSISGSAYGTILASSLIAALSYKKRGDAWVMIAALLATELVFAAAHAMSSLLERGREGAAASTSIELRGVLRYEWPVLKAVWPALLLLLLAGFGLLSADAAVNGALIVNTVVLFAWGVAVAHARGSGRLAVIATGVVASTLGVALVVLKVALH